MKFVIEDELKKIPDKSGVYIMKDVKDTVIYVGKAISLKKRVRQYFSLSKNASLKVVKMVENIDHFEYIVTDNEVEALVLECNLIKKHTPKYNVLLKDDKNYPYIKITLQEDFPRVFITRRFLKDGSKYFGPYTNSGALYETMDTIRKLFPLRTCKKPILENKIQRPCLNLHIKRCVGPCTGGVLKEDYKKLIDQVVDFLNGKYAMIVERLEEEMFRCANNLDFEGAASFRDKIKSIKTITEKQKVLSTDAKDRDVLAYAHDEVEACVEAFFIRGGKLLGRRSFFLSLDGEEVGGVFNSFISQFYVEEEFIPEEILLLDEVEDIETLEEVLREKRAKKVRVLVPKKGEKLELVKMVKTNAEISLRNHREQIQKEQAINGTAMLKLMRLLDLDKVPDYLEAFDISNIGKDDKVGGMVVFKNGAPYKSGYRRYKIKEVVGQDDYASMAEVLRRRFAKISQLSSDQIPKLILVDGGLSHVNVAYGVQREFGLAIPIFGMAKDEKHRSSFLVGRAKEYPIKQDIDLLRFISAIQDEVHRFAIQYHQMLRTKRYRKSVLDDIEGVGPKKKKILIGAFGSVEKIKNATIEELSRVSGVDKKTAQAVFDFFRD
jgi:excinuclease ABC subunit C